MAKKGFLFAVVLALTLTLASCTQQKDPDGAGLSVRPRRVILFVIDGFAAGSPEASSLDLAHFRKLIKEGSYYPRSWTVMPAEIDSNFDPASRGYYPWLSPYVSVVNASGSVFAGRPGLGRNFVQHSFSARTTAFVVNSEMYEDISAGFDIYHKLYHTTGDYYDNRMMFADIKNVIRTAEPYFMRVQFAGPGRAGLEDKAADRMILSSNSLYSQQIEQVDTILGRLVKWLKETSRWSETVLIVTGSHGQLETGGVDPYVRSVWKTPLLIVGKGIKKGVRFDYAEHIDIPSTICSIMAVPRPRFGEGRALVESYIGGPDQPTRTAYIERLNEVLYNFNELVKGETQPSRTSQFAALEAAFADIDTAGKWHLRFDTIDQLVEYNENTYRQSHKLVSDEATIVPEF